MERIVDSLRQAWRMNGWVRFENLIDAKITSRLSDWVDALAHAEKGPGARRLHYYEMMPAGPVLCRTERYLEDHQPLRELITRGTVPVVASELLGGRAVLYKEKINYKHAGGAGFAAHQDATAYATVRHHVTCLIAVDPMTRQNGCLEFAKGSFTQPLADNGDGCLTTECEAELTWEPVTLPPGGVLFFSSLVPHRSGPNGTSKPRRALYLTYNDVHEGDQRQRYYDQRDAALALRGDCDETARISTIGHFQGRGVTTNART